MDKKGRHGLEGFDFLTGRHLGGQHGGGGGHRVVVDTGRTSAGRVGVDPTASDPGGWPRLDWSLDAALLLAAAFVYWLAIGRQQGIAPPVERLQFGAGLTQDQAPPTSPLAPG